MRAIPGVPQPDGREDRGVHGPDGYLFRLAAVAAQLPAGGLPPAYPEAPSVGAPDPLSPVGFVLLAYGLVQLLSKVVERLPIGRSGADRAVELTPDDRRRLDRACELLAVEHERSRGLQEALREIDRKLDVVLRGR